MQPFGAGTKRHVAIVMYHAIDPRPHPYAVRPQSFRRQIALLAERYRVIPLRALVEPGLDDGVPEVVITFDDAYRDVLEYAYPVLEGLRLPWTVFVPTAFIGGTNGWDAGVTGVQPRAIMSADELAALARAPRVELGSHSVDHRRIAALPPTEMQRQVRESKAALEALGATVTSFAYPYGRLGDFSAASTRTLAQAGYRLAVTTHWGTRMRVDGLLTLPRITLDDCDDDATIAAKVGGRYGWIGLKEEAAFAYRSLRHAARQTLRASRCTT
jgi:peptidoglycan/xylan/chitin deacetylase (PgdA/CDA1 family)